MIGCNLQGGLGNQMFQIAAATALALRNNDTTGFDLTNCHTPLQGNPSFFYKTNIFRNINDIQNYNFKHLYTEPTYSYKDIKYYPDLCLQGFFQSEKYFNDCKSDIKKLFSLPEEIINIVKNEFDYKNTTAVHIRRGDYVNKQNFHPVCDINYYKKAASLVTGSKLLFISDDINWVKKYFQGSRVLYSPYKEEILDFVLMLLCKNVIIANSTFSWWGAYLNFNKDKHIIAPMSWFGPNGPKDTQDIIPDNWTQL